MLILTNITTVETVLYNKYKASAAADNIAINTGSGVNLLIGKFFRQTLGFTQKQMDSFWDINQVLRPATINLTYGVDSLKTAMYNELQKAVPDTVRLSNLSWQIGDLHGKLKYETFHFYLNLKKICSSAQSIKLEKAFQPLFKTENISLLNQHWQRDRNR